MDKGQLHHCHDRNDCQKGFFHDKVIQKLKHKNPLPSKRQISTQLRAVAESSLHDLDSERVNHYSRA